MANILHIETSTDVCSCALSQDGLSVWHDEVRGGARHAECLGPFVDAALSYAAAHGLELGAVAVSSGPGSYTGLRVGVSMAKGVAYGAGVPLLSVPTLQLLCVPVLLGDKELEPDALLCPMIDARRMEVFAAVYDRALTEQRAVQADIVTADTYRDFLKRGPVYFFGNGAEKCMETIAHPNAHYIPDIVPLATNMLPIADMRLQAGQTEDTAYFTPQYFKDYKARLPKNQLVV